MNTDIAGELEERSQEYLTLALEAINSLSTTMEPAEFKKTDQLIKAISALTIGKVLSALADTESYRAVSERVTPARARREHLIKRYGAIRNAIARNDWGEFDRLHSDLIKGDEVGRGGPEAVENGVREGHGSESGTTDP